MHRYIPVIAKWNGYGNIAEKVVQHHPRKFGTTKYGWERFLTGFLDLLSISFVTKFKKKPMHFFGTIGGLSFLGGFMAVLIMIATKIYDIATHNVVREIVDQPIFYLALTALIIGTQLFLAGYLAEMMVVINNERERSYLIDEKLGLDRQTYL